MGTLWTEQEHESQNYDIPDEAQKSAARKIRKTGAKVWKDGEVWVVQELNNKVAETMSPRVLVDRAVRDHYGEIKETQSESTGRRPVQVPPHKGRSDRPVAGEESVDRSPDKRLDKQRGSRGDGKGSSKVSGGRGTRNKKVPRKKTPNLRKSGTGVSTAKPNNSPRKARVGPASKSGANRKKPSRTKRRG